LCCAAIILGLDINAYREDDKNQGANGALYAPQGAVGLFGCCFDVDVLATAMYTPCCSFGSTRHRSEMLAAGEDGRLLVSKRKAGAMAKYGCLYLLCPCVVGAIYRGRLKREFAVEGSALGVRSCLGGSVTGRRRGTCGKYARSPSAHPPLPPLYSRTPHLSLPSLLQNPVADFAMHTFCFPCALSQESRAVIFADSVSRLDRQAAERRRSRQESDGGEDERLSRSSSSRAPASFEIETPGDGGSTQT
tara:strand:- start:189 stop:932 length:744 start_codon:yes stop_codon:yes gene_type:complete